MDEMIISGRPPMTGYKTEIASGFGIPAYEKIVFTPNSTTDVYQFYTGSGYSNLVNTLTITYTDSTKAVISTIIKT